MHDESTRILGELLKWTKVTSYKAVKATLEEALEKEDARLIYHLSDGKRSGVEISELTGISNATISILQSSWAKLGLLAKGAKTYEKQFSLEDFGFAIPDVSAVKAQRLSRKKSTDGGKSKK